MTGNLYNIVSQLYFNLKKKGRQQENWCYLQMYRLGTGQSEEMQFSSVILGICGFTIIFQQMAVKYQEEGVSHILPKLPK